MSEGIVNENRLMTRDPRTDQTIDPTVGKFPPLQERWVRLSICQGLRLYQKAKKKNIRTEGRTGIIILTGTIYGSLN